MFRRRCPSPKLTTKYARYDVNSVNDKLVAQATTSNGMARLLHHYWRLRFTQERAQHMLALLAPGRSWLEKEPEFTRFGDNYDKLLAKLGAGDLKGGAEVLSEATIVQQRFGEERFLIVYTNVKSTPARFKDRQDFARGLHLAIEEYLQNR